MKICRECGSVNDNEIIHCIVCGYTEFDDPVEYKHEEEVPVIGKIPVPDKPKIRKSPRSKYSLAVVIIVVAACAGLINGLFKPDDNDIKGNITHSNYLTTNTQTTYIQSTAKQTTAMQTTAMQTTAMQTTVMQTTESVRSINLTADLQYNLNLFISNFTEANLESFDYKPADSELIKFAISYNTINERQRIETGEWTINGNYYNRRVSDDYVFESISDHFVCPIGNIIDYSQYVYYDGYFYLVFTGASVTGPMGVVTSVEELGNNRYRMYFNIYNNGGNNEGLYGYDDAYMSAKGYYKGFGAAVFQATDINNYYTYYLESYTVIR